MKKAAIILCLFAFTLAGCQNVDLDKCKAENAKLKVENAKLEEQLAGALKAAELIGKKLDEEMKK